MKSKQLSPEVLYCIDPIVIINSQDIYDLQKQISSVEKKRIRLCTHKTIKDIVHEMLLVLLKDSYIHPHKHLNKIESYHVIEGNAALVLFHNNGKIMDIIELGEYDSGKTFYTRVSKQYYHTILVTTQYFVFHETTNGPMNKADTIFAEWAPNETDFEEIKLYCSSLNDEIAKWKHTFNNL